jgi:hypothetical protein
MSIRPWACRTVATVTLFLTVSGLGAARDRTEGYPPGYTATGPNGYVYVAPSYQPAVPYYDPYFGIGANGYLPPPVGFGRPYYNGSNDPNYGVYGPGVREFLRYGGADYYGW